jgi:hypothetical protein
MTVPILHSKHILHNTPIAVNEVTLGDIISFRYESEDRWGIVLQPNFKEKMHVLVINEMPPAILKKVSLNIYGKTPQVFYETYLNRTPSVKNLNSYRTFDVKKIVSPKLITYDFGYNSENPNTLIVYGNKTLLLGYNSTTVYADTFDQLNSLVASRSKHGLYIRSAPLENSVLSYVKEIGVSPKFRTWAIPSLDHETPEQFKNRSQNFLKTLLSVGGVFFIRDEEMDEFKSAL